MCVAKSYTIFPPCINYISVTPDPTDAWQWSEFWSRDCAHMCMLWASYFALMVTITAESCFCLVWPCECGMWRISLTLTHMLLWRVQINRSNSFYSAVSLLRPLSWAVLFWLNTSTVIVMKIKRKSTRIVFLLLGVIFDAFRPFSNNLISEESTQSCDLGVRLAKMLCMVKDESSSSEQITPTITKAFSVVYCQCWSVQITHNTLFILYLLVLN